MNDWLEIIFYSFVVMGVFVIGSLYGKLNVAEESCTMNDYQFFDNMVKRFADNHEYVKDGYNCVNYSVDLQETARQLGFEVELDSGCPSNETNRTCHMWNNVRLSISPQTGKVDMYDSEYPYESNSYWKRFVEEHNS